MMPGERQVYQRCAGCGHWRLWQYSLVFTQGEAQFWLPVCSEACGAQVDPYDATSQPIPERVAELLAALPPAAVR